MGGSDLDETVSSLQSVTYGALISVVGIVFERGTVFVANLLLARGLGVDLYGVYAFGERLIRMLFGIAHLGTSPALVRHLPEHAGAIERQNSILGLAYATSVVASVAAAATLAGFAPRINEVTVGHPAFVDAFRVFALLLPVEILVGLIVNHFRGLELVEYQISIGKLARPAVRVIAIALALALGYSVVGIVAAVVASTVVVLAGSFGLSLVRTPQRPSITGWRREARDFYNSSVPLAFSNVGNVLASRVDILLIGYFLSASAVGVYNIALLLGELVRLSLTSFNQLFPTIASQLYVDDKYKDLNAVYAAVSRLAFTGALAIALVLAVYRLEILALVGSEYARGERVLLLIVVGQLAATFVGPAGWLLFVTDHQYVFAFDEWALGVLNVGFSYYLILEVGLIGAAIGTAGSLAIINVLRIGQLWYLEGLFPITAAFRKPVVAGLGSGGVMYALGLFLSGLPLLVVGTAIGWFAFGALYYAQGVPTIDAALLAEYRSQSRGFVERVRR